MEKLQVQTVDNAQVSTLHRHRICAFRIYRIQGFTVWSWRLMMMYDTYQENLLRRRIIINLTAGLDYNTPRTVYTNVNQSWSRITKPWIKQTTNLISMNEIW